MASGLFVVSAVLVAVTAAIATGDLAWQALDDVAAVRAISVEDGVANVRVRAGAVDRDLEREAREALSGTGFGLGGLERPASSP